MAKQRTSLQISPLEKIGLTRLEAAAFIGMTLSAFDALVMSGEMPQPRRVGGEFDRWDRRQIEAAFSLIPQGETVKKRSPYSIVA